ncbi:MAG TPA: hypothetical protein PL151_03595 [Phycisphaerae bacterium]|nr:hypothetical protein [Phycisphaerae bacterium]HOJ75606.1 hypothetical protein [Phycisphaerae bacterium]HON66477.1 hypothetical protein [Phycisphaerae bacterium]HPP27565.1 hypothetical protein [Phycisphaerae bacterium]HPZ98456.1 hypothetical protein [Phycisphaerae bacterium]
MLKTMANDYEISRVTGKCAVTGREFQENEFYHAALFETPEGFERKDYSIEAWTGPPEGCFCHWKGRIPPREKKPVTIAVDSSVLMNLFCRLEDDNSEMRQKFRFVLALLLMRKRLLRLEQTIREEGREYWQMRLVQEQTVQRVLNPHLSEQEIDGLSAQLSAILSGDVAAIAQLEEGEASPADTAPEAPAEPASEAPIESAPATEGEAAQATASDSGRTDNA